MAVSRFLRLTLLLSALALSSAASAQQAKKVWRVGFMSPYSAEYDKPYFAGFAEGMRALGYVEGRNLAIEMRHSEGANERFPQFARELANLKVDLFLIHGTPPAILAARDAGAGVPVVFVANPDPVGLGLVASLARPGGNITGLSDMHAALGAKRLELLKEIVPSASRIGILLDPTHPASRGELARLQQAAPALQVRLVLLHMTGPADISTIFETMKRERVEAFHTLFGTAGIHAGRVHELARQQRLPTIVTTRRSAETGALLSYGADFRDLYRRAATYAHKIFNGAKPADLPIEQPAKFELVVNMRTAKEIGVKIPPGLLQRADHVIE